MKKITAAVAGLTIAAAGILTAASAHAALPGVTTTTAYPVGADTATVTWYQNGVFTVARNVEITGPTAITQNVYQSTYCTAIMRGPGGYPPISWTPPSGIRTQCDPYLQINGVKIRP